MAQLSLEIWPELARARIESWYGLVAPDSWFSVLTVAGRESQHPLLGLAPLHLQWTAPRLPHPSAVLSLQEKNVNLTSMDHRLVLRLDTCFQDSGKSSHLRTSPERTRFSCSPLHVQTTVKTKHLGKHWCPQPSRLLLIPACEAAFSRCS